jgi:hypothetical protein
MTPIRTRKRSTANQLLTWAIGGCLAIVLNLVGAAPAAALLCSTADPAVIPGGTVLNTVPADNFNAAFENTMRNDPTTHSYLSGSTGYVLSNNVPFIAAHTFTQDPTDQFGGRVGSFLLPLAQLRGLTREQYLNYWALPNFANGARNNAIVLVVAPLRTLRRTRWPAALYRFGGSAAARSTL